MLRILTGSPGGVSGTPDTNQEEITMGWFGPSRKDQERAARYDDRAKPLEAQSRELGRKAQHHHEQSRRTDEHADPAAHRIAARDAECDQESLRLEAGQYRANAAQARTPRWRR